ncbi:MAG: hypothetical protein ACPL3P_05895 [Anaerolineales bacterium]
MSETERIILNAHAALLSAQEVPHTYLCRFVRAGRISGQDADIEIMPAALDAAVTQGLFEGRAVFVDHAGFLSYPSLHDLVGVSSNAVSIHEGEEVNGEIRFYETPQSQPILALIRDFLRDRQAGLAVPDIGLSLVFYPIWEEGKNSAGVRRVMGIKQIESIDLVFQPAADGRLLHSLSSASYYTIDKGAKIMNSDLDNSIGSPLGSLSNPADGEARLHPSAKEPAATAAVGGKAGKKENSQNETEEAQVGVEASPNAQSWSQALTESAAAFMIANSGLPQAARDKLSSNLYQTPAQVVNAIEAERKYLASLTNEQVIQIGGTPPRSEGISLGLSGLEQIGMALEALIKGVRPPQSVQPLSGIRELYNLLSGDFEMTGLFHPERVYLANVNSSTMANLVADVLNKVLVQEFQEYPQWWQPFVTQMDFSSLQNVRWITLGGVGELPTVAEGAAYTELNWGDRYETSAFVKKGGYLGITIEAIDKDDTARLRAAPRALAQAAWLTLGKTISNIFTANNGAGPTLSDGVELFHSNHGNLGSSTLSLSAWVAARTAMRKQNELNSGERLGFLTAPRYLLVPPDLEVTALQILASSHDYSYALTNGVGPAPVNIFSEGETADMRLRSARERVIVVDLWTDTNDWAAVADPRLYPSIGIGFRYGRTPEIYSVSSPTAGLMFSNDVMPVKVRFFFAVGPVDYRGLYKANVA